MTVSETEACAILLAAELHTEQLHGHRPYMWHLADTVGWLRYVGIEEPEILAAAWLHDAIEDSDDRPDTFNSIADRVCYSVAELVHVVTDNVGKNRKARRLGVLERIRSDSWWAVSIKLADRLSNVAAATHALHSTSPLYQDGANLLKMYRKEHPMFVSELYSSLDPEPIHLLWDELNPRVR